MSETERYYRPMKYLSPSSYKIWCDNRDLFYQQYLSPTKRPRDPQNNHMSVGSAFDAFAKSHLHKKFVGDDDPRFEFKALFDAQVEEHNRSEAMISGRACFDAYTSSGALADLAEQLLKANGKPRFETTLEGIVSGTRPSKSATVGAIPLLGKPDLYFTAKDGFRIISDWKVNGYHTKSGASPRPGYMRLYPGFESHRDFVPGDHNGIKINKLLTMEQVDKDWATQLAVYGWILGEPVGGDFVGSIHQIVCRKTGIRVAVHQCLISEEFQHSLYEGMQDCWYRIQSGEIFDNMTVEQSLMWAKKLDENKPMDPNIADISKVSFW